MRLFPKTEDFFAYFNRSAANLVEATKYLETILGSGTVDDAGLKRMEEFEHAGDRITHDLMERLNRTFITPFDREDIHELVSRLDDVLDFAWSASEAIVLYKVKPVPDTLRDMSRVLAQLAVEIQRGVERLANMKRPEMILAICIEINRLENESDRQLADAIAHLMRESSDPIAVIKWKEVFETVEMATDSCEDVANVIEGVVIENS